MALQFGHDTEIELNNVVAKYEENLRNLEALQIEVSTARNAEEHASTELERTLQRLREMDEANIENSRYIIRA